MAEQLSEYITTKKFDIETEREKTRAKIAKYLLGGLGLAYIVVLVIGCVAGSFKNATLSDLTTAFITPIIGLVAFVFGFYFGDE